MNRLVGINFAFHSGTSSNSASLLLESSEGEKTVQVNDEIAVALNLQRVADPSADMYVDVHSMESVDVLA
jgi:hypothetical protein